MLKTHILTDKEPLENLLKGAEVLYKAVSTTMGPRGNNVIFRKVGGRTGVTHDGVTVAKVVRIDNPAQDIGADLLRVAATKLEGVTGDGTTTVTVLAYHILNEAAKHIRMGENPMAIRLALEDSSKEIIRQIEGLARTDVNEKDIINIATVAAGDSDIGETVGRAIYRAGETTPVVLNYAEGSETTIETIKGFKLGSGTASPYLLEGAGLHLEIVDALVIVCDTDLRTKEDIMPILEAAQQIPQENRKFLLVANEIAGDALSILVVNRLKGFAEIAVARTPAGIVNKSLYLQDIAVSTGGKVLSRNTGHSILTASPEDFGSAKRVLVEMEDTVIVGGNANPEEYAKHIETLKNAKKTPKMAKFIEDRLATLDQQVIAINIGANSETEAEERNYRYEDAVGASKAALRKGVVSGGGSILYYLSTFGINKILDVALKQPMTTILANAGIPVPKRLTIGEGIDVLHPDKGVINLEEAGIIDPVQTEIESVKTAVSIAGLLLTSGAMIVDEEIKDEKAPEYFSPNQG